MSKLVILPGQKQNPDDVTSELQRLQTENEALRRAGWLLVKALRMTGRRKASPELYKAYARLLEEIMGLLGEEPE